MEKQIVAPVHDDHFSVHFSGLLGYMKFMKEHHPETHTYRLKDVAAKLTKTTSKRGEVNRTIVGH
jgi:hypothetical protein